MNIEEQRKEEALAFIKHGEDLIRKGREILVEASILDRNEGGLVFAMLITGKAENTIRRYVSEGKIQTANKPGVKFWFRKSMLLEDMKSGFPDRDKRAGLRLKGELI